MYASWITNYQTTVSFPAVKQGSCLKNHSVRKLLVVSVSQKSEVMQLYNLMYVLTIANHGLNGVSSNVSPDWTVCSLGVMTGVFWRRESLPIWFIDCTKVASWLANFLSVFTSIVCVRQSWCRKSQQLENAKEKKMASDPTKFCPKSPRRAKIMSE